MSEADDYKAMALSAQRHQSFLRFATVGSFSYPMLALLGLLYGVLPVTVPVAAFAAAIFVYHMHHQRYGERQNWWWLRRGKIVTLKSFANLDEARKWAKASGYEYAEIMPGSFKFYRTPDAVHFKLIWL